MAFRIGKNCQIHPTAVIDVKDGFLGDGSMVRENARIEGMRVEIGREAFIDRGATIGGGSCFDPGAYLQAGDWLHMGVNSHINIARSVKIGHEFGCGIETKVFTHGAYIDAYSLGAPVQWAPVTIGNNVWMPNAWVNPGVEIGDNVVIAARSLVNKSLPSGCLAGGVPVKVLKEGYLPRVLSTEERGALLKEVIRQAWSRYQQPGEPPVQVEGNKILSKEAGKAAEFDLQNETVEGHVTPWTRLLKDQLRRNGIRFRFLENGDSWSRWQNSVSEI
jgi:acetyltransferase-like isoleucine patch superfamily enzyme